MDWRAAARIGAWPRVLELLDALPAADRETPEMRLVRGRAALGAGKPAEAAKALEGLASALPALADEVESWWLEAAAVAGPHAEAAKQLARSSRVVDLVTAAEAYMRAKEQKAARETINTAVTRADRLRRSVDQVRARLARAAIAAEVGDKTVAFIDWRWVVQSDADARAVHQALEGMIHIGMRLGAEAEIDAWARSATPANVDTALKKIDELAKSPKVTGVAAALGKARALWRARSYPAARDAFDAAAKLPSGFRPEAQYFAARAAARAGDSEGALERYRRLEATRPVAPWAERASARQADLLLQLGKFEEARTAYVRHLGRYGRGGGSLDDRHGHALALLSTGQAKKAKEIFVALRKEKGTGAHLDSALTELEGLAADRAGDRKAATGLWLGLLRDEPLTYAASVAHARLRAAAIDPLPPLVPAKASGIPAIPLVAEMPGPVATLHALGLDHAAEERLALLEDHVTSKHPGRESEALCALYGELSGGRRQMKIGSRATSWAELMRLPSNANGWMWRCTYPAPYAELVQDAETRHELPHGLVHAVMRQESAFRVDALSEAGAQGLMQLMPNTAMRAARELGRELGPDDDVLRPDLNVELGAFYLGKLLRCFGGSVPLAVAAYNAGPHAVQQWLQAPNERELDLWVARIPYGETREYVIRVLTNLARYQFLAGGPAAVTSIELGLPTEVSIGDDAY